MQVVSRSRAAGGRSTLRLCGGRLGYRWAPLPPLPGLPLTRIIAEQSAGVLDCLQTVDLGALSSAISGCHREQHLADLPAAAKWLYCCGRVSIDIAAQMGSSAVPLRFLYLSFSSLNSFQR